MRKKTNNRGSAMLVAIIVSVVVVAFALSLLLVAYSLFASSAKKVTQTQGMELAKTVSLELAEEITRPKFASFDEVLEGVSGNGTYSATQYPLWYYIRYNIQQEQGWPYYADETVVGHSQKYAYRYFTYSISGGDAAKYAGLADDISICMYWSRNDETEKDGTLLTVETTVKKGEQLCVNTCYYELTVALFEDGSSGNHLVGTDAFSMNPKNNLIDGNENWIWTKVEQE